MAVTAIAEVYDPARVRLREAYASDEITMLELELCAERLAASPVYQRVVELGGPLVLPATVFVYWNATTLDCEGCDQHRRISRVHLYRRGPDGEYIRGSMGGCKTFALCRPCIGEIGALGVVWT